MEPACSNIAVQRTSDDHTNYMVRARNECKIGWEATEYWSASNPCDNLDSYNLSECGGLQGMDRAITTCRLPLNQRVGNAFTYFSIPKHHACVHKNYPNSPRSPTLRIDR